MGIPDHVKPIILCADDYGVSPSVGAAIRELAALRRVSAVSCMSGAPTWPAEAEALKPLREGIDVGLHFNLTLGFEASAPSLATWLKNSLSGRIDGASVTGEFSRQLDHFEAAWGEPPDFVDGHQHVHVFPGIRTPVLRLLAERYPDAKRPWIRRVNPALTGHDAPLKAMVLRLLSIGFADAALQRDLALSPGFAGLYSLSANANYPRMMVGWLRRAKPDTVVMCHPGTGDGPDPERIGPARAREFGYLRSPEFAALLRDEQVALVRFQP